MRTIEADLDMRNRTTDGKIPLGSVNAVRFVKPGQVVRLEDDSDQLEVEAEVEIRNGLVLAKANWETLAYLH